MGYTWGYLKSAALAELDLDADEANRLNMIDKFPYYANAAMSQLCNLCPRVRYLKVVVYPCQSELDSVIEAIHCKTRTPKVLNSLPVPAPVLIDKIPNTINLETIYTRVKKPTKVVTENWVSFVDNHLILDKFWIENIQYTADISVYNDVVVERELKTYAKMSLCQKAEEAEAVLKGQDLVYNGYAEIVFNRPGVYNICIAERWTSLTEDTDDAEIIDAPMDLLDCIPYYIAGECWSALDEKKGRIRLNKFEVLMSRVKPQEQIVTKTKKNAGGW